MEHAVCGLWTVDCGLWAVSRAQGGTEQGARVRGQASSPASHTRIRLSPESCLVWLPRTGPETDSVP